MYKIPDKGGRRRLQNILSVRSKTGLLFSFFLFPVSILNITLYFMMENNSKKYPLCLNCKDEVIEFPKKYCVLCDENICLECYDKINELSNHVFFTELDPIMPNCQIKCTDCKELIITKTKLFCYCCHEYICLECHKNWEAVNHGCGGAYSDISDGSFSIMSEDEDIFFFEMGEQ